jgi:hypothetical protein
VLLVAVYGAGWSLADKALERIAVAAISSHISAETFRPMLITFPHKQKGPEEDEGQGSDEGD